ncbi:MAG: GNAT family N-acetyltransferase [Planctomycetota bacterium]|jgi:ribosomal-protein-alanine N-acetyltransferase
MAAFLQRGARVSLQKLTPRHEAAFFDLVRASAAFLRPWEPRPRPGQRFDSPERFARLLAHNRRGTSLKTLIVRNADRALVGSININNIALGPFCSASLGYWIGGPFAGQGYMGDALQLALRHAFRHLGLHRLEANVMPRNAASIALVKRAGFRLEGYSPRYLKIAGRWQDHERWALLKEEWRPRRA